MYAERDTATEEFLADIEANVKMIAEHISYLPERDQSFATSLVNNYERFGSFTAKQLPYAVKIWQKLNELGAADPSTSESEKTSKATEFTGAITKIFDSAKLRLKYPRINYYRRASDLYLKEHGIKQLIISMGARTSSYSGIIFINTDENKSLAVIRNDSIDWSVHIDNDLKKIVRRIIQSPIEELALSGREFCHCCYCGLELTNEVSVFHGYGPICATNWGLPWSYDKMLEAAIEENKL